MRFPTAMIELNEVTHEYRRGRETVPVLDRVSLRVAPGESVAVVGPSGAGKSTLLHLISGLLTPRAGRVVVDGHDLSTLTDRDVSRFRNRTIGMIFQSFHLAPQWTALENVELPLLFDDASRDERRARAKEQLSALGLAARERHAPSELSGGEMQRVAIARALVTRPRVLLADEPTGNLDRRTGDAVIDSLFRLQAERKMTFVLVTHSEKIAARAGRMLCLEDGRISDVVP